MFLDQQAAFVVWLQGLSNGFTDFFFNSVSFFGEPEFYIVLLGFIYWVYNKKLGEYLGVTLGTSIALNNVLKAIFMIDRPFLTYEGIENMREYTSTGSSFPSGHAQGNATVFFGLAKFFKTRAFWTLAIVFAVLMGLSRMFLGVHYVQDVIAGALIGLGVASLTYYFFDKYKSDEALLHRFYFILVLVFLPAVFIFDANDFFRGYGILVGFVFAVVLEKKYVNFTMDIVLWKKIVRYILGVVLMLVVMMVFGAIKDASGFAEESFGYNIIDFVRFSMVAFVGFGLYPMLFTKLKF